MIRYILVDDQPKTLKYVKAKIDTLPKDYELKHVESYDSSKKAYENINKDDFDLLIVDFDMPVYNGIELAQKIGDNKKIIFLTGETEKEKQVINSLDISGYLSKPFDIEEFEAILKNKVIGKVRTSINKDHTNFITLPVGSNKEVRFRPEQVYYISTALISNGWKTSKKTQKNEKIKADKPHKNNLHIYGKNDEILFENVRMKIIDLNKELVHYNFEKISKSTIVNMVHIKERNNTTVNLYNTNTKFEITDKEKTGFLAKWKAKLKL
ncbi:LytR/AlgR family response regulator transcription factor [Olleya sp. HaHaR_3_96]|uniref:LytR/AlgR family response regulator transcription factor n=1 Tax=Olleya sp. HaHaR_3_96 TaxID=2745560 RepID=UPI001C4EBC01|nr:response regulator [Olleya sp. HaHaR_3_96]QXP58376.1 response regulator [Olleya sp. HaHaR_3_96]